MKIIIELMEAYSRYLYQLGYDKGRRRCMPVVAASFLSQQGIEDIRAVTQRQVKDFYQHLHERPSQKRHGGISEGTIQGYMDMLRNFFTWLEITGQISYNPISGCRFTRVKQSSREPLSVEEIKALFGVATTVEQKAILHLCYSCGLRRSEAVALNVGDVRCKERVLYVREGKGAKRRVIPMTATVAEALAAYAKYRRGEAIKNKWWDGDSKGDSKAFMVGNEGSRMLGSAYIRRLKKLVAASGIDKPQTGLHHLRHSIATHLLQGGMSMVYVQAFLGHGSVNTTQIYARAHQKQLAAL